MAQIRTFLPHALTAAIMLCLTYAIIFVFYPYIDQETDEVTWGYESADHILDLNQNLIKGALQANTPNIMIERNAERVLTRLSIEDEAYAQYYASRYLANNEADNKGFITYARRLNARNRGVATVLLAWAIEDNDVDTILAELGLLYRLNESNRDYYVAVLSTLFRNPATSSKFLSHLDRKPLPLWNYTFLTQEITATADNNLGMLETPLSYFARHSDNDNLIAALYARYISRLIKAQNYDLVKRLWKLRRPNGISGGTIEQAVFNPDFAALKNQPILNWTLYNTRDVSSEYVREGGAFFSFRGKGLSTLASQYVFLPVDYQNYNFAITGTHRYDDKKGNFYLELRCSGSDQLLSRKEILQNLTTQTPLFMSLEANGEPCELAYVNIGARSGEFPQTITMTVNSLTLEAAR